MKRRATRAEKIAAAEREAARLGLSPEAYKAARPSKYARKLREEPAAAPCRIFCGEACSCGLRERLLGRFGRPS